MDIEAANQLSVCEVRPTATAPWVAVVLSFPRPLDMGFAAHVTKATVEPSDHRAELELSHHVVVLHLEFNETRHHEIDVGLTPHLHLRDLPVSDEVVVLHGREEKTARVNAC